MIIHALPTNLAACGGIKVHYELCEIERELGHYAVVAFPTTEIPTWFSRNVGEVLTYEQAREEGRRRQKQKEDILVIGWEDPEILNTFFAEFKTACYIQGDVFWKGLPFYSKQYLITSSPYIAQKTGNAIHQIIFPYINSSIFYPSLTKKFEKPYRLLVQGRKGGKEAVEKLQAYLYSAWKDEILIDFLEEDIPELEFAAKLRESHFLLTHTFPEGLGLPGLEAMASGTIPIGFSGGGGSLYMKDCFNCFCVNDGQYRQLSFWLVYIAKDMQVSMYESIVQHGIDTAAFFNKENTAEGIIQMLHRFNLEGV